MRYQKTDFYCWPSFNRQLKNVQCGKELMLSFWGDAFQHSLWKKCLCSRLVQRTLKKRFPKYRPRITFLLIFIYVKILEAWKSTCDFRVFEQLHSSKYRLKHFGPKLPDYLLHQILLAYFEIMYVLIHTYSYIVEFDVIITSHQWILGI